jgi:hypothetical protein
VADIETQIANGVDNIHDYTSNYDKWLYGLTPGMALNFLCEISPNGSYYRANFAPWRWLNYGTRVTLGNTLASFRANTALLKTAFCWAIAIDEERELACLCYVNTLLSYVQGEGSPRYYDSARVNVQAFNNGVFPAGNFNIYNLIKGSIPGGGGGSAGPYDDGGTSTGTDTGTGDFDETSDPVALPTLPSVSALSSGLISLYKVSQTEVSKFVGFLWSDSFSVASLSKIFSDPMQAIISFGMFPFDVSAGASVPIYLGKNNTGAVGDLVTAQYVTVPMGSVNLTEFYGGALDYNPYTKIQLVLPYCGVVNINPDEFMTKAVTVTYRVDILSGACVAFVSDGERVLQQVNGNCLVTLPYASTDFKQVYSSLLGLAGTAGAAIVAGATGGLTAPVVGGIGASLAMNTLNAKENYARGGAAGSTLGFLGVQTPYLVITRPRQCLPENNGHFQGYPLYTTERLGDLTGFTKVAQIHLDDIDATDSELKEIARLLTEGVIL